MNDISAFEKMIDEMPAELRRDVEIHLTVGVAEILNRCEAERARVNAEIDNNIKLIVSTLFAANNRTMAGGKWCMASDGKRLIKVE